MEDIRCHVERLHTADGRTVETTVIADPGFVCLTADIVDMVELECTERTRVVGAASCKARMQTIADITERDSAVA